jgi:hypothetical protein
MTSSATWRNGQRVTKRAARSRRRWTCPDAGCDQERITPLDTARAPICPVHAANMTKRRKVTRRRGL